MKLLGTLFFIRSSRQVDAGFEYELTLDGECFIYKAHFPGEPITPGVCIMQMALELLEEATGCCLRLDCARNIKFLQVIKPDETPLIHCSLGRICNENDTVTAQACLSCGDTILAKLSLVCVRA